VHLDRETSRVYLREDRVNGKYAGGRQVQNSLFPFGVEGENQSQTAIVASHIAGAFEGWSGRTVFRLRNGQLWQQDSPGYLYRYVYMPKVVVYPTGGGYRMRVDGVRETITVRRVR
jgi:hypothetical protein